nr:polymorphic toxin type 44 domain-containing protein [Pseudomonas asturiensis]
MGFPVAPPGVSIDQNMRLAQEKGKYFSRGGEAFLLSWFYSQVRNRGPWDFKQRGAQYEDFGNFHYGAVGTAAGISEEMLLRAAGAAQSRAGTSSSEFGHWWSAPPYGDDPRDQRCIKDGIEYAKSAKV